MYEIRRVHYGSKARWTVQMPKGILTFPRRKDAENWVDGITGKRDVYDILREGDLRICSR